MGQLEDVLELLSGPDDRFQSVRATVRHWINRDLEYELYPRLVPYGRQKANPGDVQELTGRFESTLSIWLCRPARARIEEHWEVEGRVESKLTVADVKRVWERDSDGLVQWDDAFGGHVDADRHFGPARIREILEAHTLESLGSTTTAGRQCARVRAVPRSGGILCPHWLPPGADEYELHVDLERGVLLDIIGKFGGEAFEVYEVTAIAFDEPLESHLFTYEPAPGDQVEPMEQIVYSLSLTEAVARVPFTVLVPARALDPERLYFEVRYHATRRTAHRPSLSLFYRDANSRTHIFVHEDDLPDHFLDRFEWERVPAAGIPQNELRISDPHPNSGGRIVAFEQHGTYVALRSDLDRARLIDIALSFTSASAIIAEEAEIRWSEIPIGGMEARD